MDGTTDNRGTLSEASNASGLAPTAITNGAPGNQAILRMISSTTSNFFVGAGADQNCTNTTPAGSTQCGGAGFKLLQGLTLDNTEPYFGVTTTATNGGTAAGAPVGYGVNHATVIEANGDLPLGNTGSAGAPTFNSGLKRGNGALTLATPIAPGDRVSIEFRFGVQRGGSFYLQLIPEGDDTQSGDVGEQLLLPDSPKQLDLLKQPRPSSKTRQTAIR